MVLPNQIRAARALLGWSQAELAERANVSIPTIQRAEGAAAIQAAGPSVKAVVDALEHAGVEFISENGAGVGVRLK